MTRKSNPNQRDVEWDENKNLANKKNHKLSFEEAATVFYDPLEVDINDPDHSITEKRFLSIGETDKGRLIVVSYTERGNKIRIISARDPSPRERREYEGQ